MLMLLTLAVAQVLLVSAHTATAWGPGAPVVTSEEPRPDPDALLRRLSAQERRGRPGRLKILFGAAAGVGKTYAMLEAAQKKRAEGVDVVVGWVETHGRAETAALAEGLERLPAREVEYRGTLLREFDLDAALARRPGLMILDELAHSNAPGSRYEKRWQDAREVLAAGIDVFTTLNVQHIESLNDLVSRVTGIAVRETVPDHVFDLADEVEFVDLPPEDLLAAPGGGQGLRARPGGPRRASLLPQGEPDRPARAGAAPNRGAHRRPDAGLPARSRDP